MSNTEDFSMFLGDDNVSDIEDFGLFLESEALDDFSDDLDYSEFLGVQKSKEIFVDTSLEDTIAHTNLQILDQRTQTERLKHIQTSLENDKQQEVFHKLPENMNLVAS